MDYQQGQREMAQRLRALGALPELRVQFSELRIQFFAPTQLFTAVCNPFSRGPLLASMATKNVHGVQTDIHARKTTIPI